MMQLLKLRVMMTMKVQHVAPALYLEDNRYDPARLVEEEDYEEQSTNALHDAMEQLDDRSS
jgi:RNA polymerase sigma-32 factor